MFSPIVRCISLLVVGAATLALTLGVILYRAAFITGAASDYTVAVSWPSVLTSVIWPPARLPFLPLLAVLILAGFTVLIFFRASRSVAVITLFLQAVIGYFAGGWLGWFFIPREIEHYHFNMDGEKLGENWFTYESVAVWTLAAAVLGFLRLFARRPSAKPTNYGQPTVA